MMGVLAVILGILALACGVLATFLFGTTGAIVAGALAVGAIVLGFLKRRRDGKGGIPAIVIAGLALILTMSLTGAWANVFATIHKKAVEYKPDGLWAQVSEDTSGGLMGMMTKLPRDEATMNAFMEEMNELSKLENEKK